MLDGTVLIVDAPNAGSDSPLAAAALGQRTGYLLIKLGELVLQVAEDTLVPLGLRARHFNVMAMIAVDASLSQQDLSSLLGLDPNIIVALVDDLEGQQLLTRQRSPKDRRRYALTLTQKGHDRLDEAHRLMHDAEHDLLAPLSQHEATALRDLATRVLGPRWPLRHR